MKNITFFFKFKTTEKANARYDPKYMKEDLPLFMDGTEPILILEFCRIHNCSVEGSFGGLNRKSMKWHKN